MSHGHTLPESPERGFKHQASAVFGVRVQDGVADFSNERSGSARDTVRTPGSRQDGRRRAVCRRDRSTKSGGIGGGLHLFTWRVGILPRRTRAPPSRVADPVSAATSEAALAPDVVQHSLRTLIEPGGGGGDKMAGIFIRYACVRLEEKRGAVGFRKSREPKRGVRAVVYDRPLQRFATPSSGSAGSSVKKKRVVARSSAATPKKPAWTPTPDPRRSAIFV